MHRNVGVRKELTVRRSSLKLNLKKGCAMAASSALASCYLCGTKDGELQRCGRCRKAWYCSKTHQRIHWKTHKKQCVDSQRDVSDLSSAVASACNIDANWASDDTTITKVDNSSQPLKVISPNTSDENFIPIAFPNSPAFPSVYFDERKSRFVQLADKVYDDMRRKGYSFIDGFLGNELCRSVYQEVESLHHSGIMKDGEVISKDLLGDGSKRIRDDKIIWISGSEPNCKHIATQMKEVDTLIKYFKRKLQHYDIRGRSPAMVACYPGNGTHYVKHVDNPTGDGRCITTLYYLNEDWDCEKYGGQLRLYPYARSEYTDIEPIMDRLLLFWSDKRMPHEVIPALKVRFAITLWYFDVEERAKAALKYMSKGDSGGKDSCYNLMHCVSEGHEIVALANLRPKEKDELDSFMYQTVGYNVLELYSEAIGVPLYQGITSGNSICRDATYTVNTNDEVEDLYQLLKDIKEKVDFNGVASGAVLSNYQRVRVENVCSRLNVQSIAYLWQRNQHELLEEMISSGVNAILIKVCALGLEPSKHLGKTIAEMYPLLCKLSKNYGVHVCGEGGEYESMTLDCPLFTKKIVIDDAETVIHSDDAFAPVGFLHFNKMHLEDKGIEQKSSLLQRLQNSNFVGRQISLSPYDLNITPSEEEVHVSSCPVVSQDLPSLEGAEDDADVSVKRIGNYIVASSTINSEIDGQELTIEEETKILLDRLQDRLLSAQCTLSDIVLVHVYVDNMKNFSTVNAMYREYFKANPPARVCVEVHMCQGRHLTIDCIAICMENRTEDTEMARQTLHVQSISHWAPANIGPYSQAVKVGNSVFLSGSIGLKPSSMLLTEGGEMAEAKLGLRHLLTVQSVIQPAGNLENLTYLVCYVTSLKALDYAERVYEVLVQKNPHLPFIASIVSGLPKSAAVEWHAGADASLCHDRVGHSLEKTVDRLAVHMSAYINKPSQCIFALSVGSTYDSSQILMSVVLQTIVDECKRTASLLSTSLSQLLDIRVFVRIDSFPSLRSFNAALVQCFKAEAGITLVFHFIPTKGLARNALVAMLGRFILD